MDQGLVRGHALYEQRQPDPSETLPKIPLAVFLYLAIDRDAALSDVQWRSVHRVPPPLARRSTKSENFETGIKAIDMLVPLDRGIPRFLKHASIRIGKARSPC